MADKTEMDRLRDQMSALSNNITNMRVDFQQMKGMSTRTEAMLKDHIKDDKKNFEDTNTKIDTSNGEINTKLDKIFGYMKVLIGVLIGAALMSNEHVTNILLKLI